MAETHFLKWFVEGADEGWKEGNLLEVIELVGGGTPKTSNSHFWDGDIPWLSGGDISQNHKAIVLHTDKTITNNGLVSCSTTLLPQFATVVSARGTVGKYSLLGKPMSFSQSNYGVLPKVDGCFFFTYLLINEVMEQLQASAYGSVFDTITTTTFRESTIRIPDKKQIQAFNAMVSEYFLKILENAQQICTLEAIRNTLLPKLMRGKIQVKDQASHPSATIKTTIFEKENAHKATDEFIEAVAIAYLVRLLSSEKFPLGRKRYNKMTYLAHRKSENDVRDQYLKKAAGPYSPWAKYKGPERIAVQNGYVKVINSGKLEGFVVGIENYKIDKYLEHYSIRSSLEWVVKEFRYAKNDYLELLATVDFAALDLQAEKQKICVNNIKSIILNNKDWAPKLTRTTFSDFNIQQALEKLGSIFPVMYKRLPHDTNPS